VQTIEADLVSTRSQLTRYANENADLRSTVLRLTSSLQSLEVCVAFYSHLVAENGS